MSSATAAAVTGELRKWHPVTLTFDGPHADEQDDVNPFLNYRMSVRFSSENGGTVVVPGYFAADGDAANSGADGGNKWRVHFVPRETGRWNWSVSFHQGDSVAVQPGVSGKALAPDGERGAFEIADSDKTGRDHRGRGLLAYVGERYLRFDDGSYFLKAGADSPETLLAFQDFDGTYDHGGKNSIKSYSAHVRDWNPGDPTWRDGKGKALIGAVNYLAGKGMNAFSFLTMNVIGDGKNVWPWTSHVVHDRFDVSKLAQWEVVFTHADKQGMFLHFKTQETENDQLLDGGTLGPLRKLYYRELIARFSHHLALNWNLGEENDLWEELDDPEQRHLRATIEYIATLDPYGHPIVVHSYPDPDRMMPVYEPLLGDASLLTGVSLQTKPENVHRDTLHWLDASRRAGRQWTVASDEINPASVGVTPDGDDNNHADVRHYALWGNLMAGGWGVEYYFGYKLAHNDLNAEDWASRDNAWEEARHALDFFNAYLPFDRMESRDGLTGNDNDFVFAEPGKVYAVYMPEYEATEIDLNGVRGRFSVHWFDPRNGGGLQQGSVLRVRGGGQVDLGAPPSDPGADWVVLLRR